MKSEVTKTKSDKQYPMLKVWENFDTIALMVTPNEGTCIYAGPKSDRRLGQHATNWNDLDIYFINTITLSN